MSVNFRVSVITPVYNAAAYLEKAVRSALLPEVGEIILIEDGSKDNSLQICEKLATEFKKVRLLQHPDKGNHGAAASRNLGIQLVKFSYVAFLDADDYFLPHRFKKDKEIFEANPIADGVYNALGFHYYSKSGAASFDKIGINNLTTVQQPVGPEKLIFTLLDVGKVKGYFSGDALTVKKTLLDKTGLFVENLRIGEDTHLWLRMAMIGNLYSGVLTEPVAIRGVHDANTITNTGDKLGYKVEMYKSLLNWGIENGINSDILELVKNLFLTFQLKSLNNKKAQKDLFFQRIKEHPRAIFHPFFFDTGVRAVFGNGAMLNLFLKSKNKIANLF